MSAERFSEEQIIGILKEHQAGLSAQEVCRSTASVTRRSTNGAESLAGWIFLMPAG